MRKGDERESRAAQDLKAYWFVYTVLAFRTSSRSKDLTNFEARETADALQAFCTELMYASREPGKDKKKVAGYSSSRRALWVRPNGLNTAARDLIQLEHPNELLYEGRTLVPKLRSFTKSKVLRDWQQDPVNIRSVLDAAQQEAYFRIAGKDAPVKVSWQGAILVGHDPERIGEKGVFWIGVRKAHVERARDPESHQSFWLRNDDEVLELFFPLERSQWFRDLGTLSLDIFRKRPEHFNDLCNALGEASRQQWRSLFPPVSDLGRIPRIRRICTSYIEDPTAWERHLQVLLTHPRGQGARWISDGGIVVLFVNHSFDALSTVLPRILRNAKVGRVRFLAICKDSILEWVKRFPWTWVITMLPSSAGEELLTGIAETYVRQGQVKNARWCLTAGLRAANDHDWDPDTFTQILGWIDDTGGPRLLREILSRDAT